MNTKATFSKFIDWKLIQKIHDLSVYYTDNEGEYTIFIELFCMGIPDVIYVDNEGYENDYFPNGHFWPDISEFSTDKIKSRLNDNIEMIIDIRVLYRERNRETELPRKQAKHLYEQLHKTYNGVELNVHTVKISNKIDLKKEDIIL